MRGRILALHGMTLNGATMRRQMGPLRLRLEEHFEIEWLDAPHVCPWASVEKHYQAWGMPIPDGPHLRWWDASPDGLVYRGFPETRRFLEQRVAQGSPPLLLGFSQGAIAAAALATLASRGQFPEVAGVILIAGMPPRAETIVREHQGPLELPSLHVWGEQDPVTGATSKKLLDWFSPRTRQVHVWPGSHTVPRRGPPADAIVAWLGSQLALRLDR